MIVTTILAMALTAQTPSNEQRRQAELKALAAKIHQENLAKRPKAKAKTVTPAPSLIIQYVEVPNVETGALLYVWTESLERVPICTDLFRAENLQKSMLNGDQAALDESIAHERMFYVSRETRVRVMQTLGSGSSVAVDSATYVRGLAASQGNKKPLPVCEVRILDGPFNGQTGWVPEYLLRKRVEVNLGRKTKRRR